MTKRKHLAPEKVEVVRRGPGLEKIFLVVPDPAPRVKSGMIFVYLGELAGSDLSPGPSPEAGGEEDF